MDNEKTPVRISLELLTKQVEEGMKRKELAEYYGLPEMQMAKALKQAGLKIRRFHAPKFEFVEENVPNDLFNPETSEEAEEETSSIALPTNALPDNEEDTPTSQEQY